LCRAGPNPETPHTSGHSGNLSHAFFFLRDAGAGAAPAEKQQRCDQGKAKPPIASPSEPACWPLPLEPPVDLSASRRVHTRPCIAARPSAPSTPPPRLTPRWISSPRTALSGAKCESTRTPRLRRERR
jgi:hypothetical protein